MSFFNTKCISTCITFLTNPLQTCLLTPYFLQNVLAHGSHLFKRNLLNMYNCTKTTHTPLFLQNALAHGSHEKIQKNILKHVYTHLSFLKHISMCITFFPKKNSGQIPIKFSKDYLQT